MLAAYSALAVLLFGVAWQDHPAKLEPAKPASTRPAPVASQPVVSAPSATPRDAEVLKELIREVERQPLTPAKGSPSPGQPVASIVGAKGGTDDSAALEGSSIVERTGRLVRVGQQIEFRYPRDDGKGSAVYQLQPNQLLEQIEKDVDSGIGQAILSGVVQRYRGRTFLMVSTYRRVAQRGNLSP